MVPGSAILWCIVRGTDSSEAEAFILSAGDLEDGMFLIVSSGPREGVS